jgi:hypothetical protein
MASKTRSGSSPESVSFDRTSARLSAPMTASSARAPFDDVGAGLVTQVREHPGSKWPWSLGFDHEVSG